MSRPGHARRPHPLVARLVLLLTMALCAVVGVLTEGAVALVRHPDRAIQLARTALDAPMPGLESRALADLHPTFERDVNGIIAALEARGHRVSVRATWRSAHRQEAIYLASALGQLAGRAPGTTLRGGQSCHNQLRRGDRAAAAVDLRLGGFPSLDEEAAFFHDLGREARTHGLRWGGSWSQRNEIWARFDLGWDPGHIEARGLCTQLRSGPRS